MEIDIGREKKGSEVHIVHKGSICPQTVEKSVAVPTSPRPTFMWIVDPHIFFLIRTALRKLFSSNPRRNKYKYSVPPVVWVVRCSMCQYLRLHSWIYTRGLLNATSPSSSYTVFVYIRTTVVQ